MSTAGETADQYRGSIWDTLERTRQCAFPLPPHGHCPNFAGAKAAAKNLLAHPQVAPLHTLVVGPERVLLPLRKRALEGGKTLYVPHQKKDGWYWKLTDPAGANPSKMPGVGEPELTPEGAQAAVLACVAADHSGKRLGKGYGWGARGLHLGVPEFTLAHLLMLREQLACAADSWVSLIGMPRGVLIPTRGEVKEDSAPPLTASL